MDLKAETIGLAVTLELPMVIVDVQRAGPSTGMPTKNEAADLLMAMYGRHGESPHPDRRRLHAVALLRRRARGGADRGHLPHAGDPALRHLPRATRPSRGSSRTSTTCPRSTPRSRPEPNSGDGFLPVPARREARSPVGRSRHARPRAPPRRAREAGRHREHLLRPGQPRADDAPAGRARSRRSPTTSRRSRSTTRTAPPSSSSSAGARPTARSRRAARRVRGRGGERRHGAPRPPEPVPAQPRRRSRGLPARCSCPS